MSMLTTQGQILRFRWASARAQLKLESKGMKSKGGALRPRLAAELGLKPRDSYDKFIAACEAAMQEAYPL